MLVINRRPVTFQGFGQSRVGVHLYRFDRPVTFRPGFVCAIYHDGLLPAIRASAIALARPHGIHSPP